MLTPDEAAAVLRRAAELDTPALEQSEVLDEQVLREAAREVGLSDGAVEQAVGEWRAGVLAPLPPLPPDVRAGLPAGVAVEAQVALSPQVAQQRLEAWLRGQWFERRRTRGPESEWAPRRGVLASARRAADLDRRLVLSGVGRVRVCVAPAAAGTRVRLVADLGETRRGLLAGLVATPAVVAGVATGTALGLSGDVGPEVLAALPAALGAGGLGWLGAARVLRTRRRELTEELERAVEALSVAVSRPRLPERAVAWAAGRLPRTSR